MVNKYICKKITSIIFLFENSPSTELEEHQPTSDSPAPQKAIEKEDEDDTTEENEDEVEVTADEIVEDIGKIHFLFRFHSL